MSKIRNITKVEKYETIVSSIDSIIYYIQINDDENLTLRINKIDDLIFNNQHVKKLSIDEENMELGVGSKNARFAYIKDYPEEAVVAIEKLMLKLIFQTI